MLGSDDGTAAFGTPLATLHAHQGWADVFLTTPAVGVRDLYVSVGTTLPCELKTKLVYHWFNGDDGGGDLGQEIDAVVSKQINEYWSITGKFAHYMGDGSFSDRTKFWIQTELKF